MAPQHWRFSGTAEWGIKGYGICDEVYIWSGPFIPAWLSPSSVDIYVPFKHICQHGVLSFSSYILTMEKEGLKDVKVLKTIVGGNVVYQAVQ